MRSLRFRLRKSWLLADEGSAVAEFALVTPLVLALTLGLLQVTFALHMRTTLTDAAAQGARSAALADGSLEVGEARTWELVRGSLPVSQVHDVSASFDARDGVGVAQVVITADVPVIGAFGPIEMQVVGRAVLERA